MFRSAPRTQTKNIPSPPKFQQLFFEYPRITYMLHIYSTHKYDNLLLRNNCFTPKFLMNSSWFVPIQPLFIQKIHSLRHLQGASDQPVVKLLQDAALRTNSSSLALLSRRIRSVLRLGSQGIFVGSVVKWKGFGVLEVVVYF